MSYLLRLDGGVENLSVTNTSGADTFLISMLRVTEILLKDSHSKQEFPKFALNRLSTIGFSHIASCWMNLRSQRSRVSSNMRGRHSFCVLTSRATLQHCVATHSHRLMSLISFKRLPHRRNHCFTLVRRARILRYTALTTLILYRQRRDSRLISQSGIRDD